MRALIKEDPVEGYVLKSIPIPEPKPDEILYKVEKVRNRSFTIHNHCHYFALASLGRQFFIDANFTFQQVGICGSDIALYSWNAIAKQIATLPFIPGKKQKYKIEVNISMK